MKRDYDKVPCERLCVTVEEMGKLLGISRAGAYALVHVEGFPSVTIGRRLLVPIAALQRWIDAHIGDEIDFGEAIK